MSPIGWKTEQKFRTDEGTMMMMMTPTDPARRLTVV